MPELMTDPLFRHRLYARARIRTSDPRFRYLSNSASAGRDGDAGLLGGEPETFQPECVDGAERALRGKAHGRHAHAAPGEHLGGEVVAVHARQVDFRELVAGGVVGRADDVGAASRARLRIRTAGRSLHEAARDLVEEG